MKLTHHAEKIASHADHVYEITDDGHLVRRHDLCQNNHLSRTQGSASLAREDGDSQANLKDEGSPSTNLEPSPPGNNDPQKDVADLTIYKKYLRAMGFLNAIVFLSLGIVLAVTLKFPGMSNHDFLF